MALLFSHVRVSAPDGSEAEFLVKGIPRDYDDLENYTAFEEFLGELDGETEISVRAGNARFMCIDDMPLDENGDVLPIKMTKEWKMDFKDNAGCF